MNRQERWALGEIQTLIGRANGEHRNDRNPNHMEAVGDPLEKAFDMCVKLLSKYPPEDVENGKS